jgi:hypothetical protein
MSDSAEVSIHESPSAAILSPTSNTGGGSSGAPGTTGGQVADLGQFIGYIKQFVPVLLDTSSLSNLEFEKTLGEKTNVECCKKFLGDPQTKNLIFQKFFTKGWSIKY